MFRDTINYYLLMLAPSHEVFYGNFKNIWYINAYVSIAGGRDGVK